MPAYTSHYYQPFDVSCFGPLKLAYSREIEYLMRTSITHITKLSFLAAFHKTFFRAMTQSNIQNGFLGTGTVQSTEGSYNTRHPASNSNTN
jgi:hypothetical protein